MTSLIRVFIQMADRDAENMVNLYNQNFKELRVRDKITLADVSEVRESVGTTFSVLRSNIRLSSSLGKRASNLLPPNSHFKVQESHNLLCVSLGASESWGPLSPQSTTPPFRQDPNRAKGGSPYGKTIFQVY